MLILICGPQVPWFVSHYRGAVQKMLPCIPSDVLGVCVRAQVGSAGAGAEPAGWRGLEQLCVCPHCAASHWIAEQALAFPTVAWHSLPQCHCLGIVLVGKCFSEGRNDEFGFILEG